MMISLKTCFPGIIPGLVFILETKLNLMIKQALAIWPATSYVHVSVRNEWYISLLKKHQMVLPRWFIHQKTGKVRKLLMLWIGWLGW